MTQSKRSGLQEVTLATNPKEEREETARQHALCWKRSATAVGVFFLIVAVGALWGAQAGYKLLGTVAYIVTIVGALSMLAAFLCGIRAFQLYRAGRDRS